MRKISTFSAHCDDFRSLHLGILSFLRITFPNSSFSSFRQFHGFIDVCHFESVRVRRVHASIPDRQS